MAKYKPGRLTTAEHEFIRQNIKTHTVDQIAEKLNKNPQSVKLWIKQNLGNSNAERKEIEAEQDLKERGYWKDLSVQFNEEELEMFSFHWKKLWSQFRDDVLHTEEIQIVDAIKLEIMMNRCLTAQNQNIEAAKELNDMIDKKKNDIVKNARNRKFVETQEQEIRDLEREIMTLIATRNAISKDYNQYHDKKNEILKNLKGTRDQRLRGQEEVKYNYSAIVKRIMEEPEFRREVGIEMEKMRLAIDVERNRLAAPHVYADGRVDRPLLTVETLDQ